MKTQIIKLEDHDDTNSVKDKMDWSQTPRVLLEWPPDGRILTNRLDLVLLERYCSANGSQLALLTRDQEVTFQAQSVGIPVFQSRTKAQLQPWGKSYREFSRQELLQQSQQPRELPEPDEEDIPLLRELPGWARVVIFTLAVLGVLAIGGTLLPSASIHMPNLGQDRQISLPLQAVPGQREINISGSIPAREVEVTLQDQASMPATGSQVVPSQYASGEAVFTNLSDSPVQIPANTILSSDQENSPLFQTLAGGTTPEGRGSQITLPIQALEPGSRGNLAENTITRINQQIGAELMVTNPSPTVGGADILVPAPSDADRQALDEQLTQTLESAAREQVPTLLQEGDILLTARPTASLALDSEFNPAVGSAGDTLTLSSTIQFSFFYASAADLQALSQQVVEALYSGDAYLPDLESITLIQLSDPEVGLDQSIRWEMQVSWREERVVDQERIIQVVLGKTPGEAVQVLQETFDLDQPPEIRLNPAWWSRIPALPFRIRINEVN